VFETLSVDFGSLQNVLKHPIRQRIVLFLLEKKELAYMDLMNLVEITNTGKLNYHLKILGDLIEKDENGRYHLTDKGQLASQFLLRFPKKIEAASLHVPDAVLMGFAGFLLTLVNPGFWGFVLWARALLVTGAGLFLRRCRIDRDHPQGTSENKILAVLSCCSLLPPSENRCKKVEENLLTMVVPYPGGLCPPISTGTSDKWRAQPTLQHTLQRLG
jgi:hypothetical protein